MDQHSRQPYNGRFHTVGITVLAQFLPIKSATFSLCNHLHFDFFLVISLPKTSLTVSDKRRDDSGQTALPQMAARACALWARPLTCSPFSSTPNTDFLSRLPTRCVINYLKGNNHKRQHNQPAFLGARARSVVSPSSRRSENLPRILHLKFFHSFHLSPFSFLYFPSVFLQVIIIKFTFSNSAMTTDGCVLALEWSPPPLTLTPWRQLSIPGRHSASQFEFVFSFITRIYSCYVAQVNDSNQWTVTEMTLINPFWPLSHGSKHLKRGNIFGVLSLYSFDSASHLPLFFHWQNATNRFFDFSAKVDENSIRVIMKMAFISLSPLAIAPHFKFYFWIFLSLCWLFWCSWE